MIRPTVHVRAASRAVSAEQPQQRLCSLMLVYTLLVALLSGAVASVSRAQTADLHSTMTSRQEVDTWLDGFMPYALERDELLGAVVSIVYQGELLTARGFGLADKSAGIVMDPAATVVRPGSVAKLFTWTAVMQLVENGVLELDRDINAYLDFEIPDTYPSPITMRHLMTHTAGFEEAAKGLFMSDLEAILPLEDYVKQALPVRVFPPGEVPAYSNYATALAGYIVQHQSEMFFEEYVSQYIFEPLGMNASSFAQPLPEELEARLAKGYANRLAREPKPEEYIQALPAGSLASTAIDMAGFMIAHLNAGGPLLGPATTNKMHTETNRRIAGINAMLLGFIEMDMHGVQALGHSGSTRNFKTLMTLLPEYQTGIFVSTNSFGSDGAANMRNGLTEQFILRFLSPPGASSPQPLPEPSLQSRQITGVYERSRAGFTNFLGLVRYFRQVELKPAGKGELFFSDRPSELWKPVAPDLWQKQGSQDRFGAVFDDSGALSYLSTHPVAALLPVPWYRSSLLLTPLLVISVGILVVALGLGVYGLVRPRRVSDDGVAGGSVPKYLIFAAAITLAYVFGWVSLFFSAGDMYSAEATQTLEKVGRVLQFAQFAVYGALLLAIAKYYQSWATTQGWITRVAAGMVLISIGLVIWFAAMTGLLSFNLNY